MVDSATSAGASSCIMPTWAALRPYIALEFRAGGGKLRVRVLERPGLWLGPAELERLVDQMRRVVGSLGIGDLDYGILSGERRHLDRAILTMIEDRASGAPVAFNAMMALPCSLRGVPVDVIHLGLTAVDPRFRSRGVAWILTGFTTFLLFVKNGLRPYWISNVSQVPAAIGMVCEAAANVYAAPGSDARRSFDHTVLAREIMQRHRDVFGVGEEAAFDSERFVILNAYTGGSDHLKKRFEDAPRHRDPRYNEMCERELNYERGDDFLQLGQVNLFTLWRYLSHSLPRDAWALALSRLAFVLVNTLLLPVIQWLTPDHPMGDLRPRRR
jgi:GNAT superfamily N-acetyltransferase